MKVARISTPSLGMPRCCDCGEPFIIGHSCPAMTIGTHEQMQRELVAFQTAELLRLSGEVEKLRAIADSDDGAGGEGMRLVLDNQRLSVEVARLQQELEVARRDGEVYRTRAVVGWLDGHEWIGLPEQTAKRPNAKPVFQFNAIDAARDG